LTRLLPEGEKIERGHPVGDPSGFNISCRRIIVSLLLSHQYKRRSLPTREHIDTGEQNEQAQLQDIRNWLCNRPVGMVGIVNPDNPWFLITSEEVETITTGLEEIRNIPAAREPAQEILAVLRTIRGRLA
jgi:hypothetical protein